MRGEEEKRGILRGKIGEIGERRGAIVDVESHFLGCLWLPEGGYENML